MMFRLLTEKIELPLSGQPVYECQDLLFGTRLPQGIQQHRDALRVLEWSVGGGITRQQYRHLPLRTRLLQYMQQPGNAVQVVERSVGSPSCQRSGMF